MTTKLGLGALVAALIIGLGWWRLTAKSPDTALAKGKSTTEQTLPSSVTPNVKNLSYKMKNGVKVFHLTAEQVKQEVSKGVFMKAWGYNGGTPGPTIMVNQGDKVKIVVQNNLSVPTSVHWHGLIVPNKMDGVPGVENSPAIDPGKSFSYEFTVKQVGTFMYHSHVNPTKQEMMGLDGMLIALPKKGTTNKIDGLKVNRDYSILLQEWQLEGKPASSSSSTGSSGMGTSKSMSGMSSSNSSMSGPSAPIKNSSAKASSGMAGFSEGQVPPGTYDVNAKGMAWNTFTFNGKQFPATSPMVVNKGETVLVRLGNLSMQNHPLHLHGHNFTVVAKDGSPLPKSAQYKANTIDVAPGETYDIVFKADNPGTWVFHCHLPHHTAGPNNTEGGMLNTFHYIGTPWPPAYSK